MAAINQCLDAMCPPIPSTHAGVGPLIDQTDPFQSVPSAMGLSQQACDRPAPIMPPPPPPPQPLSASAPVAGSLSSTMPAAAQRQQDSEAVAVAAAAAAAERSTSDRDEARQRALAALRSPALLAVATAVVVVLVLAVVAPPFVLKRRTRASGAGAQSDPACRWSRPRAQLDPARLALWGALAGAAAFLLPLAVDRLLGPTTAITPCGGRRIPFRGRSGASGPRG